MRPRRTPTTDRVFRLLGGTEDNDLWVRTGSTDGQPWLESVWDFTDEERAQIAAGGNIVLRSWGSGTPPVAMYVTDEQPGR